MNKLFIYLILLTCVGTTQAQDYFSTLTIDNTDYRERGAFTMNDQNYFIGWGNVADSLGLGSCLKIFEIVTDGSVVLKKDLGSLELGLQNIIVENDQLVLSGSRDSSLWIQVYDADFNELLSTAFSPDIDREFFYTTKMISFIDSYVVIGVSWSNQGNRLGHILKLNKSNLELIDTQSIYSSDFFIRMYDIEQIGQDSLLLFYANRPDDNQPSENNCGFYTMDSDLQFVDSLETEFTEGYTSGSFELLENGNIAVQFDGYRDLQVIDMAGNILWEISVEDEFVDLDITDNSTVDLRIDDNGDLILYGHLEMWQGGFYNETSGFTMKVSSDGDVLWKRVYTEYLDSEQIAVFTRSILFVDEGLLFTGHALSSKSVDPMFYPWVLKTDQDGCVEEDCGLEQVLSLENISFSDVDNLVRLAQNPTHSQLIIELLQDDLNVLVVNAMGQLIYNNNNLPKGNFTLAEDLSAGIYNIIITNGEDKRQVEKIVVIE